MKLLYKKYNFLEFACISNYTITLTRLLGYFQVKMKFTHKVSKRVGLIEWA